MTLSNASALQMIRQRLDEFALLERGWAASMQSPSLGAPDYGEPLSADGLAWLAERLCAAYAAHDLPDPHLYPIPEGGVEIEWAVRRNDATLEVDLAQRTAEWHCLNLDTHDSWETALDLADAASWRWLADELTRLAESHSSLAAPA